MIVEKTICVDVSNVVFGANPPQTIVQVLTPLVNEIGEGPYTFVVDSASTHPFSVQISNGAVPSISILFDKAADLIDFGRRYSINLTVNGKTTSIEVLFRYSESYKYLDWPFSEKISVVANGFKFKELALTASLKAKELNMRFRTMMAFCSSLLDRISTLESKTNTKFDVDSTISSVLYTGVPIGATQVDYKYDTNNCLSVIDLMIGDKKIRIEHEHVDLDTVVDFTTATAPFTGNAQTSSSKFLSKKSVWMMASFENGGAKSYKLCEAQYSYVNLTRTTSMNSKVTEPMISKIVVV